MIGILSGQLVILWIFWMIGILSGQLVVCQQSQDTLTVNCKLLNLCDFKPDTVNSFGTR